MGCRLWGHTELDTTELLSTHSFCLFVFVDVGFLVDVFIKLRNPPSIISLLRIFTRGCHTQLDEGPETPCATREASGAPFLRQDEA